MVTVEVDEEVWRYLLVRKNPGESFNSVLRTELGLDKQEAESPESMTSRSQSQNQYQEQNEAAIELVEEADEPVSTSEIKRYVDEEIGVEISIDSWWQRHGRPSLKKAGGTHERNVGWSIE